MAATLEEAERVMEGGAGRQVVSDRKVDAHSLEYTKQHRRTKEERMQSVLAGREGREGFGSAAARRKTKQGGTSNREKAKRKFMPLAARSVQVKKRKKLKGRKAQRAREHRGFG